MNDLKNGFNLDDLARLVLVMLFEQKLPEDLLARVCLAESPELNKIAACLMDIRELSVSLKNGDLDVSVNSKGFVLSNLKALQSNLRHLTWQTKMIAKGDFSQQVDFLGDFSAAFNEMVLQLRDTNISLIKQATLDTLTQIPNRLSLVQFLTRVFDEAKKFNGKFSVISFDIDHFKNINDTHGHAVGDAVLIRTAALLSGQFRDSDIFARCGGEEFMAVLPNTDVESAKKIGMRALTALEATRVCDEPTLFVTVSAGVSELKDSDLNWGEVTKRSDQALYLSKKNGRNCLSAL